MCSTDADPAFFGGEPAATRGQRRTLEHSWYLPLPPVPPDLPPRPPSQPELPRLGGPRRRRPVHRPGRRSAPHCSRTQPDEVVAVARRAFPSRSRRPVEQRREFLRAMADTIEAHAEELAELITAERGNPGPSRQGSRWDKPRASEDGTAGPLDGQPGRRHPAVGHLEDPAQAHLGFDI
ncbi:aldehyde dehydrogenase family protein [Streptomyces pseudogriseolus]|uniref:aldehyde dehydrogenase family protein n=1 Tax=Streptomyces pseudogriseolus TaxID=36817 RepID=UPI003FA23435